MFARTHAAHLALAQKDLNQSKPVLVDTITAQKTAQKEKFLALIKSAEFIEMINTSQNQLVEPYSHFSDAQIALMEFTSLETVANFLNTFITLCCIAQDTHQDHQKLLDMYNFATDKLYKGFGKQFVALENFGFAVGNTIGTLNEAMYGFAHSYHNETGFAAVAEYAVNNTGQPLAKWLSTWIANPDWEKGIEAPFNQAMSDLLSLRQPIPETIEANEQNCAVVTEHVAQMRV